MTTKPLSPRLQALVAQARANHAARLAGNPIPAPSSTTTSKENQNESLRTAETVLSSSIPVYSHNDSDSARVTSITTHIHPGQSTLTQRVMTQEAGFHPIIPGFEYNDKQISAIELAMRGKSICLIGAAGTGKTTTTREVIGQLVRLPHISPINSPTKWLQKESPGIVIISFTNKAVNNIKRFLPEELQRHCLTYHKLLQYEPVRYFKEAGNPAGGTTMMFEPSYNRGNKLPHISCVIVEESSMVESDPLHTNLLAALPDPDNTQFIFLGDLNQLPPIFGDSILGFKLLELPTVELTHVYRQALESPIITLAHQIREGKGFQDKYRGSRLSEDGFIDDRGEHGKVTLYPWKKKQNKAQALGRMKMFIIDNLIKKGHYDFENDIILCPFNKSVGTIELNRAIADYLGQQRAEPVWEVIARGSKSYWSIGDRVLVDRREAIIIDIRHTPGYAGPVPERESLELDRWGNLRNGKKVQTGPDVEDFELLGDGEDILDQLVDGDEEEAKNSASHTIKVEFTDSGVVQEMSGAGEVNSMLFSYVLTVHKSQGSEWNKVFIMLHYSHNVMLTRELLYTAVTRAKKELFIICEPDRGTIYNSITRAAKSPEITGVTLQEKAAYFMSKRRSMTKLQDKPKPRLERVPTKGEAIARNIMQEINSTPY